MRKLEILDVPQGLAQGGLREMHDAILSSGSLPPRLMRERPFPAG
jgi:hypothetical protein